MHIREALRSFDWVLTGAAVLLVTLGLTMIFSTTSQDTLVSSLFIRQTISLAIAITSFFIISIFPYHNLRRYAVALYIFSIAALLFVSQAGEIIRGTTSRLEILGVQIQPSEFMKISLVILTSWVLSSQGIRPITKFIISGSLVTLAAALVIAEPDIGVAALILMFWIGLIAFSGFNYIYLSLLALVGSLGFFGAWRYLFADYQKERIITFLNPTSDPLGAGYNIVQSIVALGSGSFLGRGLGHGPQSQLKFLPEQHTDFILASVGEELGFVGILLIVVLYLVVLWRILKIAQATEDSFGQHLAVSVFLLMLIGFFVSAGMNMGLLPVTGIPLPLISYGGSSLLSTFIILGIAQSVHVHSEWVRKPPSELSDFV